MRHQPLRRREAPLAVSDLIGDRAQVGFLRVLQHHEVVPVPLLIAQKEILAVRGVDAGPVQLRLIDGRDGRVLVTLERDPKLRQSRRYLRFLAQRRSSPP